MIFKSALSTSRKKWIATRERARLGLGPNRLTGVVLFGGEGSMQMVKVARTLD